MFAFYGILSFCFYCCCCFCCMCACVCVYFWVSSLVWPSSFSMPMSRVPKKRKKGFSGTTGRKYQLLGKQSSRSENWRSWIFASLFKKRKGKHVIADPVIIVRLPRTICPAFGLSSVRNGLIIRRRKSDDLPFPIFVSFRDELHFIWPQFLNPDITISV